jgi:hypothetical protein
MHFQDGARCDADGRLMRGRCDDGGGCGGGRCGSRRRGHWRVPGAGSRSRCHNCGRGSNERNDRERDHGGSLVCTSSCLCWQPPLDLHLATTIVDVAAMQFPIRICCSLHRIEHHTHQHNISSPNHRNVLHHTSK